MAKRRKGDGNESAPVQRTHWDPVVGRLVPGEHPYEPPCSDSRRRWYAAVLSAMNSCPMVPTPLEAADMIENIPGDSPPDLATLMDRLRHWPADQPYVPLPDDDALEMRVRCRKYFDAASWTPGAIPSVVMGFSLLGPRRDVPVADDEPPPPEYPTEEEASLGA